MTGIITTCFGAGFLRLAPGTAASALAVAVAVVAYQALVTRAGKLLRIRVQVIQIKQKLSRIIKVKAFHRVVEPITSKRQCVTVLEKGIAATGTATLVTA